MLVEEWLEKKERIYGVTTGFGEFSNVNIPFDKIEELQHNLIASHAAGTGEPLPPEVVRAMMILRMNALAKVFPAYGLRLLDSSQIFLTPDLFPLFRRRVPSDQAATSCSSHILC